MRCLKKTVITIEMQQRTFIRPVQAEITALCGKCSVEVLLITPERAADSLRTTPRVIYGLLENGKLHSIETESGQRLICCNSLFKLSNKEKE